MSSASYDFAWALASVALSPTNSTRLGLALNMSVFYHGILDNPSEACRIARKALDDANEKLHTLSQDSESYKDSALIVQLLKDNLTLWGGDRDLALPVP